VSETLIVFEYGERFCTLGDNGEARIFEVMEDGSVILTAGPQESI
jgi:hypothetical protein